MQKKGFTLMEILIVLLIIGILFTMYSASYSSTKINRKNEKAIAMFMEFANAARLFNEMFPNQRIVGKFGDNAATYCTNCKNPCSLFVGYESDTDTKAILNSFGLREQDYGITQCSDLTNYEGYEFVVCNPLKFDNSDSTATQPITACDNSDGMPGVKFAVMSIPNNSEKYGSKYAGKHYWITRDYTLANDLVPIQDLEGDPD